MSSLLVILFGLVKQFCRFWIVVRKECKTPCRIWSTTQLNTPTPPQPHTVCIYCTFSLGRRGDGQREGRGATVHKLPTNTNHEWMFLQTIKSVKHNAANSINMSILKKSRHWGFGVYSSLVHKLMYTTEQADLNFQLIIYQEAGSVGCLPLWVTSQCQTWTESASLSYTYTVNKSFRPVIHCKYMYTVYTVNTCVHWLCIPGIYHGELFACDRSRRPILGCEIYSVLAPNWKMPISDLCMWFHLVRAHHCSRALLCPTGYLSGGIGVHFTGAAT